MSSSSDSLPPRGRATRSALIEAAIQVFGRDGYDAATTKAIARAAGANQALISYHFGGKERLYAAAVEHIADQITLRMGPIAEEAESARRDLDAAASASSGGRQAYFDLLCRITEGFVDVLTDPASAAWAKIVIREQQDPSAAFDTLYDRVQERVLAQIARLVARIGGRSAPSAADRLTALTIVGQILVFRLARAAVLRFTGWEAFRPREVARIKKALRLNLAAMLEVTPR